MRQPLSFLVGAAYRTIADHNFPVPKWTVFPVYRDLSRSRQGLPLGGPTQESIEPRSHPAWATDLGKTPQFAAVDTQVDVAFDLSSRWVTGLRLNRLLGSLRPRGGACSAYHFTDSLRDQIGTVKMDPVSAVACHQLLPARRAPRQVALPIDVR